LAKHTQDSITSTSSNLQIAAHIRKNQGRDSETGDQIVAIVNGQFGYSSDHHVGKTTATGFFWKI